MNNFRNILIVVLFLVSCNGDTGLGPQYQKALLTQKGNTAIYCYNLLWGFDSEEFFISSNKNICMGFDSSKDYCFGRGYQTIYYKFENDTLRIYSYGSMPTIPHANPINIVYVKLESSEDVDKYEKEFKEKKLEKVIFDSIYDLPCTHIKYFNPIHHTIKFEDSTLQ